MDEVGELAELAAGEAPEVELAKLPERERLEDDPAPQQVDGAEADAAEADLARVGVGNRLGDVDERRDGGMEAAGGECVAERDAIDGLDRDEPEPRVDPPNDG